MNKRLIYDMTMYETVRFCTYMNFLYELLYETLV